jgi:nucleoside-diphosphate-sugar epimerase
VFGAAGWVGRAVLAQLRDRHEVRAVDYGPGAWDTWRDIEGDWDGDTVHADISDFDAVEAAVDGMEAVIHTAVFSSRAAGGYSADSDTPYLVNLKGLWNVLEAARTRALRRVVHIGSCQVEHPQGVFFDADVRRPDGSPYAIQKRLQEEMCRQVHEAYGLPIVVLRPCSIVDSRLGLGKSRNDLQGGWNTGWVCRHDLAEACRLAVEIDGLTFEVLHMAGTEEADAFCNRRHGMEVLGLDYRGDLDQYR